MCAPSPPNYQGAAQQQGTANQAAAQQGSILSNPNVITPTGSQTVSWGQAGGPNGGPPPQKITPNTYGEWKAGPGAGFSGSQSPFTEAGSKYWDYLQGIDAQNSTNAPFAGQNQATVTQTLSPEEQNIFNLNQQARTGLGGVANQGIGNVSSVMGQPFNFSGTPQQSIDTSGVAPMPVNPGQTGQNAIMSRLQPQIQQQRQQLQTQLVNQGLTPGSEAYDNAMRIENQQENDMLQQAALSGLNLDFQANQQGFGQAQSQGTFSNTALQQYLAQALQQRELPLNEVSALMSGSQVNAPQFQGYQGTQVQPAPIMQGVTNQGNYNAGVYNSQMQGLYGLGGAGLMGYMMRP